MNTLENGSPWCGVCSSQHGAGECPGYVELTGPEEPGRRFAVHHEGRLELYQTLVAQAGDRWRARIVTVPNMLWGVPGGKGTAKFLDTSGAEAERKAVLFIYRRCKTMEMEVKELYGNQDRTRDWLPAGRRGGKRHEQLLPALFGVERPSWPARVSNISPGGLFLATGRLEEPGTRVNITLHLEHFRIPLTGIVAWVNTRASANLMAGIGVELEEPPFVYRQYVETLDKQSAQED